MTVESLLLGALSTLAAVILANHAGLWVSGREFKVMQADRDFYQRLFVRQTRIIRKLTAAKGDDLGDLDDDGDDSERVA